MPSQQTGAIAQSRGPSERVAIYRVPDGEMAIGSTLGGPKVCAVIKATGALERVYSTDMGETLFGTLVVHHWDDQRGMHLDAQAGEFILHPEHQEHIFHLTNDVTVHEQIFVLSGQPATDGTVDPPAVYYTVSLRNDGIDTVQQSTYAFCQIRGETTHDVRAEYDEHAHALVVWNERQPNHARVFGASIRPMSYEVTLDHGKAVAQHHPGQLRNGVELGNEPLGVLHHTHTIEPGAEVHWSYLLSFSGAGKTSAVTTYRDCPDASVALDRTKQYYHQMLDYAVVLTPNAQINRGVLWAKANMLRVMLNSPTGRCFTNDPARSNNSVAQDTAWFNFGADYFVPDFVAESLQAYMKNQEPSGEIVEYYDIRTNQVADYGLNINDNTALLILALWHHYISSGDEQFLRQNYAAAAKAARYILSQRNTQGLVWCTANGQSDWGIVGWRNVIKNYRLSGATTELNSECYAALQTMAQMADTLDQREDAQSFARAATDLRDAINTHLFNPANGLYHLNIDIDGRPCSDVTADLVFPVLFDVATPETAAHIIHRLSNPDFWAGGGMHTVPRDAHNYSPREGYGLLGGVWVGMTFWYAFAAAKFAPRLMDEVMGLSFANFSQDPRKNNTVPGQFSEWLHGETLVNEGMMLSPWLPPRYLWAAIEGVAGMNGKTAKLTVAPNLAPDWRWLGARRIRYRGRELTWLAVRAPSLQLFTNFECATEGGMPVHVFDEDCSAQAQALGDATVALGWRRGAAYLFFVGSTDDRSLTTSLTVKNLTAGMYQQRSYDSLEGNWRDEGILSSKVIQQGITLQLESKGFRLIEFTPEMKDAISW